MPPPVKSTVLCASEDRMFASAGSLKLLMSTFSILSEYVSRGVGFAMALRVCEMFP